MTTKPRIRSARALLTLLATAVLALGAIVLPVSAAHADSSVSVGIQLHGGYNNQIDIGSLSGTISRVGNTFSYSFTVCRQSSYTPPWGTINGQYFGGDGSSSCPVYSGSFSQSGPTVNLRFTGNTFYPGNTFQEVTKTKTYYLT